MEKVEYWFNTKTKAVEQGKLSLSVDRLGPYETYEQAKLAEQTTAERARQIREQDDEDWA